MKHIISLLLISGCSAVMVIDPSKRPENAPSNYRPAGVVKYLNGGMSSIRSARREDAFKKMKDSCGGDYKILAEDVTSGSYMLNQNPYGKYELNQTGDYIYIRYECSDKLGLNDILK